MEQKAKILLIGKAGQGKSSLGNFLLNEARFLVSDIPNKMQRSINKSERNGLTIIDTCGLGYENDTNNFKEIIQCISNDYINEILIVMNAQENRITYDIDHYASDQCQRICSVLPMRDEILASHNCIPT